MSQIVWKALPVENTQESLMDTNIFITTPVICLVISGLWLTHRPSYEICQIVTVTVLFSKKNTVVRRCLWQCTNKNIFWAHFNVDMMPYFIAIPVRKWNCPANPFTTKVIFILNRAPGISRISLNYPMFPPYIGKDDGDTNVIRRIQEMFITR